MFFVRRTGCQGNALKETGLWSSRAAPRRCQAWTAAGVFLAWWTPGLVEYEAVQGMAWEWLAMDGAMTTAPLGGAKGGQASDRPRADWHHPERPPRRRRHPHGPRRRGCESA